MRVSIITVSFNSEFTIEDTISSVLAQTYPEIEYIIIDGGSTDGTRDVINSFGTKITKFISESDNGMYDALNKGIRLASGDIVGILNSDDFFYNSMVIEKIVKTFLNNDTEAVIGDVQFVDPLNNAKINRYYSSRNFNPSKFRFGFMPAHPGFYVKRDLFEKYGYYKIDYEIAADYELIMRFLLTNNVSYKYLEIPIVSMRTGGISNKSLKSNYILNKEIARACRENGIYTNYAFIYSKYLLKFSEFLGNRNK